MMELILVGRMHPESRHRYLRTPSLDTATRMDASGKAKGERPQRTRNCVASTRGRLDAREPVCAGSGQANVDKQAKQRRTDYQ